LHFLTEVTQDDCFHEIYYDYVDILNAKRVYPVTLIQKESGKFDLNFYRIQLSQATKLGSISNAVKYIPGASKYADLMTKNMNMDVFTQEIVIIDAMTPEQRNNPMLIFGFEPYKSKAREEIAVKAKTSAKAVQQMLDKYTIAKSMFEKMSDLKKQGKELPNSLDGLMDMAKELQKKPTK